MECTLELQEQVKAKRAKKGAKRSREEIKIENGEIVVQRLIYQLKSLEKHRRFQELAQENLCHLNTTRSPSKT